MPPKKKKEQEKAPVDEVRNSISNYHLLIRIFFSAYVVVSGIGHLHARAPHCTIDARIPEPAVVVKALQALNQHMQKCKLQANIPHNNYDIVYTCTVSAAEQNCKEIAGLGVVPSLVGLLSSPVKAVRSYTALSLSIMTTSGIIY